MRSRRAAYVSAPPLNCGVRRNDELPTGARPLSTAARHAAAPRGRRRTYLCKRIVTGVWLVLLGVALLNDLHELGFAGPYSKQAVNAVWIGMAIWLLCF